MFTDRIAAGRRLAQRLQHLKTDNPIVLGLPRGGLPVALEVASALHAPLDVIVVRKLGAPRRPELAMGAIGEDGVRIINYDVARAARVTQTEIIELEMEERVELERRVASFRGDRDAVPIRGRTVVVVDDGIATGATARAACQVVRARGATRVILAVPVAPSRLAADLGADADEVIHLEPLNGMFAISQAYGDFPQLDDDDVLACLQRHAATVKPTSAGRPRTPGEIDPALERAGEEARGVELFADPYAEEAVIVAREEAEGYELFEAPDAVIPLEALREGAPGHESLTGDGVGLGRDAGDERREERREES